MFLLTDGIRGTAGIALLSQSTVAHWLQWTMIIIMGLQEYFSEQFRHLLTTIITLGRAVAGTTKNFLRLLKFVLYSKIDSHYL